MIRSLYFAAVVQLLAGCATTSATRPSWPPPPAQERIRHLRTLSGRADLESSVGRFLRELAGAEAPVQMYHPVGVAVSPEGTLLAVTDQALSMLFLFDLVADTVTTVSAEVLAGVPVGVALSGEEIYVVVPERQRLLVFSTTGELKRQLTVDCERPTGVAVDRARRRLYLSDTSTTQGAGHSVHVHDLETGEHQSAIGQRGDGKGAFLFPTFIALSPSGGLLVADTLNSRVQEFDSNGAFLRQFGERGDQFGQFDKPKGIATDSFGNVYVVDSFFSAVQIFNPEAKLLLFFGGRGDSAGFLSNPAGIAIDARNRIYVANGLNFRIDIYELVNTTAADSAAPVGPPPPDLVPAGVVAEPDPAPVPAAPEATPGATQPAPATPDIPTGALAAPRRSRLA